jgi:hypothetical protein
MTAKVYKCKANHMSMSANPLTKCPHMVNGKACTAEMIVTNTSAARFLTTKSA